MRRFRITRDPKRPSDDDIVNDTYPWYVQEITHGDDRDDYGRMESHDRALHLVGWMLKNPPGSEHWGPEI